MRMILDTDPGNGVPGADVDDCLAIGLALRSPEIELEAITVVAGNVSVDQGVRSALEILEAADAPHVPVHRGAARPLMQDPAAWRRRLDGRRDEESAQRHWHDVRTSAATFAADPTSAARVLVDRVNERPGEITVLAIGPLTNIATAMTIDPEWSQKIKQLVVMAGAFDVRNVLHELNAAYDPEATHIVMNSAAPLLIVPLDVTLRTFMRLGDVDVLDAAGTPLASYLGRMARPWITWLAERFGEDGCALHDPLALAALLDPRVITTRTAYVDVELRGRLTRGRMVSWNDEMLRGDLELPAVSPVMIAGHVDNDLFMPLLLERLTS
ncbi:nucleoside hydrolase [Lentzea sp. DG1S-22]|uniref:nucleoside hydrolase n=1 Tax=Lentzea sp. DG1S-22 TaxID=3108822 RepID=UPI002E76E720|nr:nucleoside hydrolase [Lentzea sp. DG1S-22]WVH84271.1 nucleoside hydrolase [Lentzea sp. DG1S-22]